MHNAMLFMRLDYQTIKPYLSLKNMLLFAVVFIFIGWGTGSQATVIGMMMMYGMIYASYPFAVGEKNGIDALYATLPLTRCDVVRGRYFFVLMLNAAAGVLSLAVSAGLALARGDAFNVPEALFTVLACFLLYTFAQAVQLPLYFRLGYAKAKALAYLPLVAMPAVVILISGFAVADAPPRFFADALNWLSANMGVVLAGAVLVWMAAMAASIALSQRFYRARDL